jgi:hypothetical protein
MPKAHNKAPHNTHAATAQTDLLLNAAMKKNVPTTKHQMGIGSIIKVSQNIKQLRASMTILKRLRPARAQDRARMRF